MTRRIVPPSAAALPLALLACAPPVDRRPGLWRDARVRLRIGDRLYEQRLVPIESPAEQERVQAAYAEKYAWPTAPPDERPPFRYFEVVERE